jgi:hypothetical protein
VVSALLAVVPQVEAFDGRTVDMEEPSSAQRASA